jgi:transposase-like protein
VSAQCPRHASPVFVTNPMPKLTIRSQNDTVTRKTPDQAMVVPQPKPCPRCRVMLEVERTYVSKGLSGQPSTEHRFTCPACDARYHYSTLTTRWRELTD